MLKRLAPVVVFALSLSLFDAAPAAAAECDVVRTLTSSCPRPAPQSQSQPSQSQPSQSQPSQPESRGPGFVGEAPDAAGRLMALVNHERTSRGLRPLNGREDIAAVAGPHSTEMARQRNIWHNDAYFTPATRSKLGARALGENVAMAATVDIAHRALMDSAAHRANILNGGFDTAGFSVVHDERGYMFVTQNFITSNGAAKATAASEGKDNGKAVRNGKAARKVKVGGKAKVVRKAKVARKVNAGSRAGGRR